MKTRDSDVRIAQQILESLPAHEREALIRFYMDREDPMTIARTTGMREENFSELRHWSRETFRSLRQR